MYVIMMRHSDHIQRKLAENKSRLLMLACGEVAKSWPACGWILRLFETIFKNLNEKDSGRDPRNQSTQDPSLHWSTSTTTDIAEHLPDMSLEDRQHDYNSSGLYQDPFSLGPNIYRDGSTNTFNPELPPQFLNIPDIFDTDILSALSQDIGHGQNFYSDLMEN